jgi:phosphatidylinositol alpha-mannosyltransferase
VDILGPGNIEDLPKLFREASLTVLPSMWEAYGMVVVESWACGTPVVVTDHAGLAELVTCRSLGAKFDPAGDGIETTNDEGLAEAISSALEMATCPQARVACRKRAESLTWEAIGPQYEEVWKNW